MRTIEKITTHNPMRTIDKLIINSPYKEPAQHWYYHRTTKEFQRKDGRRSAGYMQATPHSTDPDDPGMFHEIELVNKIRPRVKRWDAAGHPGCTGMTKRLLRHWHDTAEREYRFFFCQLEAIKTLIWLLEAPAAERVGIDIPDDGGPFQRYCSKMATGSGKTVVMAMIIAWNFLNKVTNPTSRHFSKYALLVAPGLTVKSRLQVLDPTNSENYYTEFNIVPSALMNTLRQGKVYIHNWHSLAWDTQEKIDAKIKKRQLHSVDQRERIEKSGAAYVRAILRDARAKNIIVINDEAHHAWRVNPKATGKGTRAYSEKDSAEEATVWVGGLDKIHAQIGILHCFDLSATPFVPSGKHTDEDALFTWIVSDFGLNDAIESGLVKTPRVAITDDSEISSEYKSRLYHIYVDPDVKDNINRKAANTELLPSLVADAYKILGDDWKKTQERWQQSAHPVPPVMITVTNRTDTSARIMHHFTGDDAIFNPFADGAIKKIDSKELKKAEAQHEPMNIRDADLAKVHTATPAHNATEIMKRAELLRREIDTVGQKGQCGAHIQHVISVGMLSEGWDAKTVTHIMGLRAFTSQLLCEQVVGRGLRRISYETGSDGLFKPEYVNIFGVPFSFLPHEGRIERSEAQAPTTRIEVLPERKEHRIAWPNVERIDWIYSPHLHIDWEAIKPISIDPTQIVTRADVAAIVDGKPNKKLKDAIGLDTIDQMRMQTVIFHMLSTIYADIVKKSPTLADRQEILLVQLARNIQKFIASDKITIEHDLYNTDKEKRVIIILRMREIILHICEHIHRENTTDMSLILDVEHPVKSTSDMRTWFTSRQCDITKKSHISHCVYDSQLEQKAARVLEDSAVVESFAKNDHLGFAITYHHRGATRKYYPDFLIRLTDGTYVVLEIKGQESERDISKREHLQDWIAAINTAGEYGTWCNAISYHPGDINQKLAQYMHKTTA